MCLYPRLIKNRKYQPNKKNGGVVPAVSDERVLAVPIGCGKCMECMKQKKREQQQRLHEELRNNKLKAYFITLTFSAEELKNLAKECKGKGYELDNNIASLAVRRFTERWRKKFKKTIRHWLITELGGGRYEHLHMHGIVFTNENPKEIEKAWKYGYMYTGEYVNEKTINYIVKYINKPDEKHKYYTPKIYASKGIGKNYLNRIDSKNNIYKNNGETNTMYKTKNGQKIPLSKYYRNKIYTEEEKEKLWIELLDKNKRYVDGIEIDISTEKGIKMYEKLRNEKRIENKKLGYGELENWRAKEYEEQRRMLIHKEREIETPRAEEKIKPYTPNNDEW